MSKKYHRGGGMAAMSDATRGMSDATRGSASEPGQRARPADTPVTVLSAGRTALAQIGKAFVLLGMVMLTAGLAIFQDDRSKKTVADGEVTEPSMPLATKESPPGAVSSNGIADEPAVTPGPLAPPSEAPTVLSADRRSSSSWPWRPWRPVSLWRRSPRPSLSSRHWWSSSWRPTS